MINELDPLISYIVPSYNHGLYIEECLDSILNDGYENKELMIVDDGSSDNSVEIINKWIEKNFSKIRISLYLQKNEGISKTLNLMIEKCNGKYVRFIASDDLVEINSSKKFLHEFNLNKNLGCVFGDCEIIDQFSTVIHKSSLKNFYRIRVENYQNEKKLKREIILNWSICGPSSMYKKSIFKKVGKFDESLIIEDWDMFIRLVKINAIKFIPDIVASYRFHKNNTSRFNNIDRRLVVLKHIKKTIINNLSEKKNYEDILLSIKIYHVEAKIFYLRGNYIFGGLYYIKYLLLRVFK